MQRQYENNKCNAFVFATYDVDDTDTQTHTHFVRIECVTWRNFVLAINLHHHQTWPHIEFYFHFIFVLQ